MSLIRKAILVGGLASALVSAIIPNTARRATILERQTEVEEEYDYIIVGGGTSGLTVGDRLTEDPDVSVLVIEYGYLDDQTGMNPVRMFNITSTPQPGLKNRSFNVGIGAVVGGSSSVNGQVFLRGTSNEYDIWGELSGDPEKSTWNWKGLLPYFIKGINFTPPPKEMAEAYNVTYDTTVWGNESSIYATFSMGTLQPRFLTMYNAMAKFPHVDIPVDGSAGTNGLYYYTTSMDPDQYARSYARTGHWDGLGRDNYQMVTGSWVSRLVFDGDAAVGVEYAQRGPDGGPRTTGEARTVRARKEVILAAGAIHTPQILQLSGIGPKALLDEAKIPVRVDLPGVGNNFQDHSYIPAISYRWSTAPPTPNVTAPRQGGGYNPVMGTFLGLPAITPDRYEALAAAYEAQDPATHLPAGYTAELREGYRQQQRAWARAMRERNVNFLEYMMAGGPGGSIQNLHCHSRGTVAVDPADPEAEVVVDYRAGSNPVDVQVMVEIIRWMRRYMTTGALAPYGAVETAPGAGFASDEELADWAAGQIIPSVYHPVGTAAKMPREWGGVVDEDLLVYGVERLRVVDASMMPTIVGATTSMTVYAVAEKAADMIKAANQ